MAGHLKFLLSSINSISESYLTQDKIGAAKGSVGKILQDCHEQAYVAETSTLRERCRCLEHKLVVLRENSAAEAEMLAGKCQGLEEELASAKSEGLTHRNHAGNLQSQIDGLQERMMEWDKQRKASCEAAEAENKSLLDKIDKLQQLIDHFEEQTKARQHLQKENDNLTVKVDKLQKVIEDLKEEKSCIKKQLTDENESLMDQMKNLQKLMNAIEEESTHTKERLCDENESLSLKVRILEAKLEARSEAVQVAQAQTPIAEELISLQQDENSQLQEKITELELELTTSSQSHNRALAQQTELHTAEREGWKAKEQQLEAEVNELHQRVAGLEAKTAASETLSKVLQDTKTNEVNQKICAIKQNSSRTLNQQAKLHSIERKGWNFRQRELSTEAEKLAERVQILEAKDSMAQTFNKVLEQARCDEVGIEPLLMAQQREIEALLTETAKLRKMQTKAKAAQANLEEAAKGNEILNKENVQLRNDVETLREQLKQMKVRRAMAAAAGYDLRWTQERAQLEDIVRQREDQVREIKAQNKRQERALAELRKELLTARQVAEAAADRRPAEEETNSGQTAGETGVEGQGPSSQQDEIQTKNEMVQLVTRCNTLEEALAQHAIEVKSLKKANRRLSLSLSFGPNDSMDKVHNWHYSLADSMCSIESNMSLVSSNSEVQLMKQIDDLTQQLAEKDEIIQSFNNYIEEWKKYKQEMGQMGQESPQKAAQLHAPIFRNPVPAGMKSESDLIMVLETGMWRVRCEVYSASEKRAVTSAEFPCLLARPKFGKSKETVVNPALLGPDAHPMFQRFCQQGTFVGADAWVCVFDHPDPILRSNLQLVSPLDPTNETISKEDVYQLWQCAFDATEMDPVGANVVVSHKSTEGYKEWSWMVDVLFSMLNVESVCLVNEAVMSARGFGVSTAVVVDIGEAGTRVTPVYEGFALTTAARRLECGGTHLNNYLLQLLAQHRSAILGQALKRRQLELAREIKDSYCFVAPDFEAMVKEKGSMEFKKVCVMGDDFTPLEVPVSPNDSESGETMKLEIPTGDSFCFLAGKELFYCPEILFQPDLYSESEHSSGLPEIIMESINACDDEDIRHDLMKTIILTGKTSHISGLKERLQKELLQCFGKNCSLEVFLGEPQETKSLDSSAYCADETEQDTLSAVLKGIRSLLQENNEDIWINSDMYSSDPDLLKNYRGF